MHRNRREVLRMKTLGVFTQPVWTNNTSCLQSAAVTKLPPPSHFPLSSSGLRPSCQVSTVGVLTFSLPGEVRDDDGGQGGRPHDEIDHQRPARVGEEQLAVVAALQ